MQTSKFQFVSKNENTYIKSMCLYVFDIFINYHSGLPLVFWSNIPPRSDEYDKVHLSSCTDSLW